MSKEKEQAEKNIGGTLNDITKETGKLVTDISTKTKKMVAKSQAAIVEAIDQNGNGELDIEDIIIMSLKIPGMRVNRSNFLQKELFKNYPQNVIDDAIKYNPAHAGITVQEIDKIADAVIQYERTCVTGISTVLGAPGGLTDLVFIS